MQSISVILYIDHRNIMYSCMKNGKMRPVDTIPGMWEGGNKGE
jgi:hypothetical protein